MVCHTVPGGREYAGGLAFMLPFDRPLVRKLYGKFGYIDFVPEPDFHPAEDGSDQIDLTLTADHRAIYGADPDTFSPFAGEMGVPLLGRGSSRSFVWNWYQNCGRSL
jgi:hypothetical protein